MIVRELLQWAEEARISLDTPVFTPGYEDGYSEVNKSVLEHLTVHRGPGGCYGTHDIGDIQERGIIAVMLYNPNNHINYM